MYFVMLMHILLLTIVSVVIIIVKFVSILSVARRVMIMATINASFV